MEEKKSVKESLSKENKGVSPLGIFVLGILVVVIIAIIGLFGVAKSGVQNMSTNSTVLKMAGIFKMPIAKINSKKVLYSEYIDDVKTLEKFYEAQGVADISEEEISGQVLSRLMANYIIEKYAKVYDVAVAQEDIDQAKSTLLSNFPSQEEAEKEIQKNYGWSMDKYLDKIVKPVILEQKLAEAFSTSDDELGKDYEEGEEVRASHILFLVNDENPDQEAKKQAEEVLQRIKDGEDFAKMAAEFGSDGTSQQGGDLDWFGKGMMVPEFEEAVFPLEIGELKQDLVKTAFGYHIVKMDDKRSIRNYRKFMGDQLQNSEIEIYSGIKNPFAMEEEEKELVENTSAVDQIEDVVVDNANNEE